MMQPVCYNELPEEYFASLVKMFWGVSVIDLTPGVGTFMLWCIANNIGYCGICHNSTQREWLQSLLVPKVQSVLANPSGVLTSQRLPLTNVGKKAAAEKKNKGDDAELEVGEPPKKKVKVEAIGQDSTQPESSGLSPNLAKLLAAARVMNSKGGEPVTE